MFIIAKACPICEYGNVGFRICSDDKTIVLMCDECDAIWSNTNDLTLGSPEFPQPPDYLLNDSCCSISAPRSRWANLLEIEAAGLLTLVSAEGKALDE